MGLADVWCQGPEISSDRDVYPSEDLCRKTGETKSEAILTNEFSGSRICPIVLIHMGLILKGTVHSKTIKTCFSQCC